MAADGERAGGGGAGTPTVPRPRTTHPHQRSPSRHRLAVTRRLPAAAAGAKRQSPCVCETPSRCRRSARRQPAAASRFAPRRHARRVGWRQTTATVAAGAATSSAAVMGGPTPHRDAVCQSGAGREAGGGEHIVSRRHSWRWATGHAASVGSYGITSRGVSGLAAGAGRNGHHPCCSTLRPHPSGSRFPPARRPDRQSGRVEYPRRHCRPRRGRLVVAALQPLPPPAVDNAVARAGAERPPQRRTGRRQRQPLPRAVGRHPATRAPGRALHQISPSPRGRTRFPAAADHAAFCVVARPRPSTPTGQTRTAAGMLRVGAAGGSLPTHRGGGRRAVLAGDAPPRAAHCSHASLCAAGTSGRSRGGGWRYTTWMRWRRGAGRRSRRDAYHVEAAWGGVGGRGARGPGGQQRAGRDAPRASHRLSKRDRWRLLDGGTCQASSRWDP